MNFHLLLYQSKPDKDKDKIKYDKIKDIDGNKYLTVQIGDQRWMAENLKTTKFNDGTTIPNVTNNDEWSVLTTPGYRWYNDDATSNKDIYGALYNWYVGGNGSKNVCPTGWHVPTSGEWSTLITYLGGQDVAGGKLKATGTIEGNDGLWYSPNTDATNETGFSALPGGMIDVYFIPEDYPLPHTRFTSIGFNSFFWTSTQEISYVLWHNTALARGLGIIPISNGISIRCIKNN